MYVHVVVTNYAYNVLGIHEFRYMRNAYDIPRVVGGCDVYYTFIHRFVFVECDTHTRMPGKVLTM